MTGGDPSPCTAREQADGAALRDAAIALVASGDAAGAWALVQPAIKAGSNDPLLLNVAGLARFHTGQPEQALQLIERAASLAPDNAGIAGNLGNARLSLGNLADAIDAYERAVALAPQDRNAWRNLCTALQKLPGDAPENVVRLRRAFAHLAALDPADPWPEIRMGVMAERAGQPDDAIAHYRAALARDPKSVDAWNRLGVQLGRQDLIADATEAYRQALGLDPGNGIALSRLVLELDRACDWVAAAAIRPRLLARSEKAFAQNERPVELTFAQLGYCDDPAAILHLARATGRDIAQRAGSPLPPAATDRNPDRQLRIGFLSHDFRNHAVSELVRGVLQKLDRNNLQIIAYSSGPDDGSPLRQAIREAVDRFHDVASASHRKIATQIRADAIDILVDLTGHTAGSRLDVAALRPAPVQICWLGYPGTTGADFIDWLIADATVIPAGDERFYAEAVCRLPHTYLPMDDAQAIANRPTRASENLPDDAFVFCSFNNMHKIEPVMFALWMELLRDVPNAVLWLHAYTALAATNLRAAARAHGVDPARLIFAHRPTKAAHLARAGLADLALDTRLYNGHTTTIDMLWAGVPVVTTPGRSFQARVSASLLRAAGLPELIAPDLDAYRALALGLARDPSRLAALKSKIAQSRGTAPLFDTGRFARDLERALRLMWQRYCAGAPRAPLDVPAG